MAGRLTTHVLDTAQGRPAASLAIQLWRIESNEGKHNGRIGLLKTVQTTTDGRTEQPLLEGEELEIGVYELVFAVGAYFAAQEVLTARPPFLDMIPVRFGIADATAHYHVPLLVSPWAYSTYRGS